MKRNRIAIFPLLVLFCGCVADVEEPTTDAVEEQLIGKWQSEPAGEEGERTRTEIRFSAGKITKMELRESRSGSFVPDEDAKGGRKSVTYFYQVDSEDDSSIQLTVSTEFEFTPENVEQVEIEMIGEDKLTWRDQDGLEVTVVKVK